MNIRLLLLGSLAAAPAGAQQAARHSPYFGQPLPGLVPQLFAPGVVSTDSVELNVVFAPDLKEMFFARRVDSVHQMLHSVLENGVWSTPRLLNLFPDRRRALAVDMALTIDGQELFFLSDHPAGKGQADIWRSRRIDGRWAPAEVVPPPISTEAGDSYPVLVADGSLYFTSNRPGGLGTRNLYRAQRLADGSFAAPVLVPAPINSELGIGDTWVAPDESYMVLTARRPPNLGAGDLYVSFRRPDGGWTEPANLGNGVNTDVTEFCPMVTPDGRFLFFSRRQTALNGPPIAGDVYWVDVKILEQFRP